MKTRNIITQSSPEQLRFPASNGLTIRADFNGGVLSTDLGPLILGGVDRQIPLTHQMEVSILMISVILPTLATD